jgi:CO/xanthine dehydrogenase Mo-binding subunit
MPGVVGRSVPRKEGHRKLSGQALYVDDLSLPGLIYGATIRSAVPRGRLRAVRFGAGILWDEFTVVTAADIPGTNSVAAIVDDQPFLVESEIRHAEEPVLLVAHPDRYRLDGARRAVALDVDPLPAVTQMEQAGQVLQSYRIEKGDVEAAWARADLIVEGEYETGAQEQLYLEPHGALAVAGPQEGVTVWGSMQCPYYVHRALVKLFGLPEEKVRVIQCETGGGFGGKEDYPSLIAGHAALLAWKSGRPVKIVYDRAEDMAATTKRHPSRTRHRTALTRDGKLLAMEIDFTLDGGAYTTLSPVVLSRGSIHAAGPYSCPNIRVRARALATNKPPCGAFRGFGAPQSLFALERHMNRLARAAGLSPEEFRRRNFLAQGDQTATGQVIREQLDLPGLLDRALELSDYHARRERFARENPASKVKRGMGFACFLHGAGFTGSGERKLASVAGVEATAAGRVRVLTANTEIGQGANTVLAQIAAEALGVDYDLVDVAPADTAFVPDSGPTVASRTVMVVGKLVESAALGLKRTLEAAGLLTGASSSRRFRAACREYVARHGPLRSFSQYEAPPGIWWDDEHFRGDAYGAFAWAVHVAQVAVDTLTYETRVEDFVAVQEVGRVVNPVLAAGQIEGGVAQAIGWALSENVVWREGRMANARLADYIIPTAADTPPIRVAFVEHGYPYGPGGAKGIGELPMDGPAPAIANAVENALGIAVDRLPILPETLEAALG